MPRVAQLLDEGRALAGDDARRDAEVLLCAALDKPRSYLYAWTDAEVPAADAARYRRWLSQRREGVPVAYLLGRRDFWSLSLEVGPATLVPRPETELLVEAALALPLPALRGAPVDDGAAGNGEFRVLAGNTVVDDRSRGAVRRVADLGTGSGAIALALASERADWQVTGVDISAAAVEVAERNRRRLALGNVLLLTGDWFAPLQDMRFDVVVSNPPYVAADDPHLTRGDLPHEPVDALVADEAGMAALRRISAEAPSFLVAGGWLLLEHGMEQGGPVRRELAARGFEAIESRRDLAGHERITLGRWPGETAC